jgi:hypothetical protein
MPTIFGEIAFCFELRNGGRIRGVAVGVDHPRRGMVLLTRGFGPESALLRPHPAWPREGNRWSPRWNPPPEFASVGGRGLSQMTPGVPDGENRIKLPKSASSVTRTRSVSMANRRTSRSVFPAKPAARASRRSTASVAAAHRADRMLKFSSNNRRTQDSASTISSAAARAAYSHTAIISVLLN